MELGQDGVDRELGLLLVLFGRLTDRLAGHIFGRFVLTWLVDNGGIVNSHAVEKAFDAVGGLGVGLAEDGLDGLIVGDDHKGIGVQVQVELFTTPDDG